MRNMSRICLAALLAPLAACGVADDGETHTAALGVTVTGLTLSAGTVGSNEWCVFDVDDFNAAHAGVNLTAGHQVRIWRPGIGNLGACTVRHDAALGANDVRMSNAGFARVEGDPTQTYTVSVSTEVAYAGYPHSDTNPPKAAARDVDEEFFEWRRYSNSAIPASAQVVAIAPHGGGIEQSTAEQARVGFYNALPTGRVVDWECYGYNKTVADSNNGFDHWHITSSEINPASFPILGTLVARQFAYAISFHGFGEDDFPTWGNHVFVGGGESALFRREMTDVLNTLSASTGLTAIYNINPGDIPGGMDGDDPDNIVNRFNTAQRGIQLEQAWNLRGIDNSLDHSIAIAQKAASVYACLTDTAVTMSEDACGMTMTAQGAASSAACGRFVADKVIPASYSTAFTLRASLDVSSLTQAQCATVTGYASIYQLQGGRFERRAGGQVIGVWSGSQCTTAVAPGNDTNINAFITESLSASPPASGQDTYRVTVGGTHSGGTPLTGVATLTRASAPPANCCNTAADCAVVVDTCDCTCLGVHAGEGAPACHDPISCVVSPCLGLSPACNAGLCSAGASEF